MLKYLTWRGIWAGFTEGFDTADLKDAKALLDELAPPLEIDGSESDCGCYALLAGVLIGGASGSGKTSVSYRLANHFNVGITEIDDFQVILERMTTPEQQPELHW